MKAMASEHVCVFELAEAVDQFAVRCMLKFEWWQAASTTAWPPKFSSDGFALDEQYNAICD